MNTSDIKIGETHHALFKGLPGTGKSIAAHSYPQPSYTFDIDRKMTAVASAYKGKNFEYEQFDTAFDILSRLDSFRKSCPYKTLIFDGWASYAKLCLQSVLKVRAPGKTRVSRGNIETYQIEDYNSESRAVQQALDDLKYIHTIHKVNVITIAHVIYVESYDIIQQKSRVYEGLFIPGGKIAFEVPVGYDELYEFTVESSIQDGSTGNFMCTTTGAHSCKTTLKVPKKFNWTGKNFYKELMDSHERESRVVTF